MTVREALAPLISEMKAVIASQQSKLIIIEEKVTSLSENITHISRDLEEVKSTTTFVVPGLVPYINNLERKLSEEISSINASIAHLYLNETKDIQLRMNAINSNISRNFSQIAIQFEEHHNKTRSEMADLQALVQFSVHNPPIDTIASHVAAKLVPYINETEQTMCDKVESSTNSLAQDLERYVADIKANLAGAQEDVTNHSHGLEMSSDRETILDILKSVNVSMTNQQVDILNKLAENKNHVTLELSHLRIILQHSISSLPTNMLSPLQRFILLHMNSSREIIIESANSSYEDVINFIRARMNDIEGNIISELNSMNAVFRNQHTIMETQLHEHTEEVALEMAGLQAAHGTIKTKLDSLDTKQDGLTVKVMTLNSELEQNITEELKKTSEFLHTSLEQAEEDYECGGTGGWKRVAYMDMTHPNTNCPSGWRLTSHSIRTCGRVSTLQPGCDSVFFPVNGYKYTRVCGLIRAYQFSQVDAFEAYHEGRVTTIDGAYVAGVSLTHGSPRQHIWTFAAGASEVQPTWVDVCPCDASINITIPPFVGEDYFCESGDVSGSPGSFIPEDPLWDGKRCSGSSTCCSLNNPPFFTKTLLSPSSDDIEARLCQLDGHDSPVELVDLYVKFDPLDKIEAKLNKMDLKQDELSHKVTIFNAEFESDNITKELQDIAMALKETNDILETSFGIAKDYECGSSRGWTRVVSLDMTDPNATCPQGWNLVHYGSINMCGKGTNNPLSCDSVFFPVIGGYYSSVCGSIRAYQFSRVDAFEAYHRGRVTTIDEAYVAGVSLTHGNPRQHIWTFAAGASEARPTWVDVCPCDATINITVPSFVGEDYFCESGVNLGSPDSVYYTEDPLWDGMGCISSSRCCSFNDPPYFVKQLPTSTSEDIEARLCQLGSRDDSAIEFMEIYVKYDTFKAALHLMQDYISTNIASANSELQQNLTKELKKSSDHVVEHISGTYECGGTGGWKRVVYLNMSDPTTNCPSGWSLTSYSKRTCGKANATGLTCHSVFFPVSVGNYTSVCGSIIAYQHGHIDAFEAYDDGQAFTIDEAYVAGVSLTHGYPRQHIWTFAAGSSEDDNDYDACPCDTSLNIRIPPFVGEEYFCESGVSSGSAGGFHPDDPLWDGEGCIGSSRCCSFNNPPYFVKQLPSSTSDDIEARLCLLNGNDDSPIEFIELYVKTSLDDSIEAKLNILEQNQNELSEKIEKVSEEIGINVVANITKQFDNKAEELEELTKQVGKANNILHTHVGQMDSYECGGTGGWRRVVYLNMSDPTTNCPPGWSLTSYSKRTCGKANNNGLTCHSVFFPVIGGNYTSVCGSIVAYQYGHIDAFEAYDNRRAITIDQAYVAGVSLTHGNPRQHIWTFAAAASETYTSNEGCPCNGASINLPPFIGGDYFCESGESATSTSGFHPDDPLWDGEGCTGSSRCCSFNSPHTLLNNCFPLLLMPLRHEYAYWMGVRTLQSSLLNSM